jgi:biopolymer transport protein ExbB/TolQ
VLLQQQIIQLADQIIATEDAYSAALSTSAAVSPLLGLLGTVWGLVHSFMSIAATQSADIAAVAPGIAEALVTTIAGLFVAIPALVMYNIVQRCVRSIEDTMYTVADAVIVFMHHINHRGDTHVLYTTTTAGKSSAV